LGGINQPGGCQSRYASIIIQTIHFSDYSKIKIRFAPTSRRTKLG
jgi:hypothetical protein